MKIQGPVKAVNGPLAGEQRPRPHGETGKSAPAGGSDARVDISSLSARMSQAEAALATTPVVDQARVEEIRTAIREGQFKVDPERIADGLLDNVREMLNARPPRA